MTSSVSLCNRALDKIGGTPIVAMADDSESAQLCNRHYEETVDELLSMHPWTFAKGIRSLNRISGAITGEYDAAFQLPGETLTVWGFVDDPEERIQFEVIEDNILLANSDTADVWISKKVTNAAKFSKPFTLCFVPLLASRMAYRIADAATKENAALTEFLKMFDIATSIDSQQGNANGRVVKSELLDSREDWGTMGNWD